MKVHVTPADFAALQKASLDLDNAKKRDQVVTILRASAFMHGDTYSEILHRAGAPVEVVVLHPRPAATSTRTD